jgi:hypothetical protein
MSYPDDLLKQASLLISASRGKPTQANLRRAVSASYYALFHHICTQAAGQILPANQSDLRRLVSRTIAHNDIKKVCVQLVQPLLNQMSAKTNSVFQALPKPALKSFCQTFIDLIDLRHRADYDLAIVISKAQALEAKSKVDTALSLWAGIADPERAKFVFLVLFNEKIRAD